MKHGNVLDISSPTYEEKQKPVMLCETSDTVFIDEQDHVVTMNLNICEMPQRDSPSFKDTHIYANPMMYIQATVILLHFFLEILYIVLINLFSTVR